MNGRKSGSVLEILLCVMAALSFAGCVRVKPWQREHLAAACMESPFAPTALVGEYRDKVVQSKTAGGLPGAAPGGGCGCTQ